MPPPENKSQIDGSKLSKKQLDAASQFLDLLGWTTSHPSSKVRREDIARIIAWYGAIRYQAAANGMGTLEAPGRPLIHKDPLLDDLIEVEITDLHVRSL